MLFDNAPIHTAGRDHFININRVFPLRLPPYSPEFQPIEEFFGEFSHFLKTAHQDLPAAMWHALAIDCLTRPNMAFHFKNCLMEAVRNIPELAGEDGVWSHALEPLPEEPRE